VISGKDALRRYWAEGVRRGPGLHFELPSVYAGTGTIVIRFRNEQAPTAARCSPSTMDWCGRGTARIPSLGVNGEGSREEPARTRSELGCF